MKGIYLETEKKILASGIELTYLADEYLFRNGQKAEYVFYLLNGSVGIEWSNQKKILTIRSVNCFIGIQEALSGEKYSCHAHTAEISKFLVFERSYFLMLFDEFEQAPSYFWQKQKEFTDLLTHFKLKIID